MDSVHGFGARAWPWQREEGDNTRGWVHLYSFLHCNCSLVDSSLSESPSESLHFFAHPLLPVYTYIVTQVISNRYGSLLSAVAMGLNIPLGVTVRPTHGKEIGLTMLQLPPCALHAICMVWMWRWHSASIPAKTLHALFGNPQSLNRSAESFKYRGLMPTPVSVSKL